MAVQPLAAQVGVAPACQALGVSRATFYRRQRSTPGHQQPRPTPARAHGGEDVGPLVADLTRPGGTLAPAPPPVTHPALVADARFILKPQL